MYDEHFLFCCKNRMDTIAQRDNFLMLRCDVCGGEAYLKIEDNLEVSKFERHLHIA